MSRDPNAKDWNVFDGGTQPVGRIYEDKTAPTEDARWLWAVQITGAHEAGIEMTGRAPTLDEAKAVFKKNYEAWQDWAATGMPYHRVAEAVSAKIIRWDGGRVGVTYVFADGQHLTHAVRTDDWPVIDKLKAAGMLTYADEEVRAGWMRSPSAGLSADRTGEGIHSGIIVSARGFRRTAVKRPAATNEYLGPRCIPATRFRNMTASGCSCLRDHICACLCRMVHAEPSTRQSGGERDEEPAVDLLYGRRCAERSFSPVGVLPGLPASVRAASRTPERRSRTARQHLLPHLLRPNLLPPNLLSTSTSTNRKQPHRSRTLSP